MDKRIKYGIIICALVLIGFGGYATYQWNQDRHLVKETTTDITDTDRVELENQVEIANKSLGNTESNDRKFELHIRKAELFQELGKLEDARNSYNEAVLLFPDRASALSGLADVQIAMNDLDGASASLKKILETNNSNGYWKRYIDLEANLKKSDQTTVNDLYLQALASTENDVVFVEAYARFLEQSGNLTGAKEYWLTAKTIEPEKAAEYDAEISRIDGLLNTQP